MTKQQKNFLLLLDPDEPTSFCHWLNEAIKYRPNDAASTEVIREFLLGPLDWFMEKAGNTQSAIAASELRLIADEIRYRFENAGIIVSEQAEALKQRWLEFQAVASWDNVIRLKKMAPDANLGRKTRATQRARRQGKPGTDSYLDEGRNARIKSFHRNLVLAGETDATKQTAREFGLTSRRIRDILKMQGGSNPDAS